MIEFDSQALDDIKLGVDTIADAVKVTFGPAGKNVIIYRPPGSPIVTKDGVTVARSVSILDNQFANAAVEMIKDVAGRTCTEAGDGTTTSTIIAQSLFNNGYTHIKSLKNTTEFKKGIDMAIKHAIDYIENYKEVVKDENDLYNIAYVSSNRDGDLSKLISKLFNQIGPDGVVTIEDSRTTDTHVESFDGLKIDRGYLNPYFVNSEHDECVLTDCKICIVQGKVSSTDEILPVLNTCAKNNKSLLLLCDDIEPQVLSLIIKNVLQHTINACVVKSPSFGEYRKDQIADISTIVGCEISNLQTKDISLGSAEKIIINKEHTIIVDGKGDPKQIINRVEGIRNELKSNNLSDFQRETLQTRLAKLTNGIAVIYVGGFSEIERQEKKDRTDDAVKAVQAAYKYGFVAGGGSMLLKVPPIYNKELSIDELEGVNVVYKALEAPIRQLLANADIKNVDQVIKQIKTSDVSIGYNVITEKTEDLIASGIIDPVLVIKNALINAASVVGLLLTTKCIILREDVVPLING